MGGEGAGVVHGAPLGAAVFDTGAAIGLPGFNLHDLADVQIDIAVGAWRGTGGVFLPEQVPAHDRAAANHGRCHDLHGEARPGMGGQSASDQTGGQHQQVESAAQQLKDDGRACEQPPEG